MEFGTKQGVCVGGVGMEGLEIQGKCRVAWKERTTTKAEAISLENQEEVKSASHVHAVVSSVRKAGGSFFLRGGK